MTFALVLYVWFLQWYATSLLNYSGDNHLNQIERSNESVDSVKKCDQTSVEKLNYTLTEKLIFNDWLAKDSVDSIAGNSLVEDLLLRGSKEQKEDLCTQKIRFTKEVSDKQWDTVSTEIEQVISELVAEGWQADPVVEITNPKTNTTELFALPIAGGPYAGTRVMLKQEAASSTVRLIEIIYDSEFSAWQAYRDDRVNHPCPCKFDLSYQIWPSLEL